MPPTSAVEVVAHLVTLGKAPIGDVFDGRILAALGRRRPVERDAVRVVQVAHGIGDGAAARVNAELRSEIGKPKPITSRTALHQRVAKDALERGHLLADGRPLHSHRLRRFRNAAIARDLAVRA